MSFCFCTYRYIFEENVKFNVKNNWIGVVKIPKHESSRYCLVNGKQKLESVYYGEGNLAYNGIAGIYDYEVFGKNQKNQF